MSDVHTARDVFDLLSCRYELVSALEDGPKSKAELTDELACSRSTVDRSVRHLETYHLLERDENRCLLTRAGLLALETYRDSLSTLETITAVAPSMGSLSPTDPFDPVVLDGATVHEPHPHAPGEPIERIADVLREATRLRGLTAVDRLPQFRRILTERTTTGALEADLVFTEDLLAFMLEAYPDNLETVLEEPVVSGFVIEGLPYEIALLETPTNLYTFVVVSDDEDVIRVIENTTQSAYTWGETVFQDYQSRATPLSPSSR